MQLIVDSRWFNAVVQVQHIHRVHKLKYERRNIKNPVSTVQPSTVLRQRKIYQLVSPLEYFRISNFPFSWNHLSCTPRTWIKSEPEVRAKQEKLKVMHSFRSHTITEIFFRVLLCSFYLGKTVLSQNNKWKNNRVTQSTWSQTRDWVNFIMVTRGSRQCRVLF